MNLTIAIYPSRSLFIPLYLLYPRDLKRLEPLTLTLTLYILLLLLLLLLAFRLEREVLLLLLLLLVTTTTTTTTSTYYYYYLPSDWNAKCMRVRKGWRICLRMCDSVLVCATWWG